MSMTRKEFLGSVLKGTALTVVAVGVVTGCGGDDGGGDVIDGPPGACTLRSVIASNHGHVFTVTQAEVDAGTERTYDIEGTGGHTHSVTITASQFATIASGGTVNTVSTSGSSHTHDITVNCV